MLAEPRRRPVVLEALVIDLHRRRDDVEVTAVQAPSRLALSSTDKGQLTLNTFTVAADGTGSRVERVMEVQRPGGVVGLVFPLIAALLIRPDVAKGLARLKSNLEGRA